MILFRIVLYSSLMLLPAILFAQAQASHWYFGENAGLDFSSGAPAAVTNGSLNASEGVSSISDKNGKLLFYTDGETIFTRRHNAMINGSDLTGSFTSSQSALIVPFIGDNTRFYVFTVAEEGTAGGLSYNVVNMNTADGDGIVERKNIQLITPVAEKLTAVQHCNGQDIWVITHGFLSDAYYSYLVTESGVSMTPVVSHVSYVGGEYDYQGCLKVSPDGENIVAAHRSNKLEFCDFDNVTGTVANPRDLSVNGAEWTYGVEFSSDSRLLYAAGWGPASSMLFQFDITAPDPAAIISSQKIIAESARGLWGTLQMGPDHRIYMAMRGVKYLSVITLPSLPGQACAFKHNAIRLTSNSELGLPAFIESFFNNGFGYSAPCNSRTADFTYKQPDNVIGFEWQFGDPASGSNNSSFISNPQHIFSDFGTYTVMLIRSYDCDHKDTVVQEVSLGNVRLELGNDTTLCERSTLSLQAGPPGYSYIWQNGSRQPWYNIRDSGEYFVELKYGTCIQNDTIRINYKRSPVVSLGNDVKLCSNETWNFTLIPEADFQYAWENGSDEQLRTINTPGIYSLSAYNSCGRFTDSIKIGEGNCTAYLPNAFSPNGDGRNDIFTVGGAHNVKEFEMQIFNRWGQLVYLTQDPLKGWNGTLQDRQAPEGNYTCMVKYKHPETGNIMTLKGVFVLFR